MTPFEVVVIILVSSFVIFIFGREIYKIVKGKSSECACCKKNMSRAMKKAKNALAKEKNIK